ncbi:MAG: recombinase family protein, partial [Gammaproteobacteria bacterium]
MSGSTTDRPELNRLLGDVEDGEHVVVWKLDRLGRSLQHLLTLVSGFRSRNIDFTSLTEQLDTSTRVGRVLFSIMGALSELERDLIVERTVAGIQAAK